MSLKTVGCRIYNCAVGSGTDPAALLGCGRYLYLGNRVVLWAGYDFGLTSASPDGTAKLGVSFAF